MSVWGCTRQTCRLSQSDGHHDSTGGVRDVWGTCPLSQDSSYPDSAGTCRSYGVVSCPLSQGGSYRRHHYITDCRRRTVAFQLPNTHDSVEHGCTPSFPAHSVEGVVSSVNVSSHIDLIDLCYFFLYSPRFFISIIFCFSFVLFGFGHLGLSAQCLTPTGL